MTSVKFIDTDVSITTYCKLVIKETILCSQNVSLLKMCHLLENYYQLVENCVKERQNCLIYLLIIYIAKKYNILVINIRVMVTEALGCDQSRLCFF